MRELTEKETLNKKHFLMFMELIGLSPTSLIKSEQLIRVVA